MATQSVLLTQLGDLLGFEDGADDILDHLLTIESKNDIREYMVQLLGSGSEKLAIFVDNIERVRNGEVLEEPTSVETATTPVTVPSISTEQNNTRQSNQARVKGVKEYMGERVVRTITKGSSSKNATSSATESKKEVKSTATDGSRTQSQLQKDVVKITPKKGKASKVCGCFGTIHSSLTNCLYCGRISCSKEGYDYCPFCGYMVDEVKPPADLPNGSSELKAWQHKERLLKYDKDFAQRTKIFDDQADYYNKSSWLSEEQRLQAEEKEEERSRKMHQRENMQLNLDL